MFIKFENFGKLINFSVLIVKCDGLSFQSRCEIEPILSGNLPPGFDPSTCRSVYAGNIHTQVTEILLQEVFSSTGLVESCKLIRKEKSSYGFIHYFDRRSAALAILSLNGRQLFGQPIKVNWAYANSHREDTSSASLQRQGKFKEAIKYHSMVLEMSDREGETSGNTEAYGAIADCFTEIGELEQAGKFYDKYISQLQSD